MTQSPRHSVSVAGAIINDQSEVLAIRRRDNGHWEPPGGVLELHETLHDGLKREVKEETGLIVEPQCLTGVYQNLPRGIVAFVFRCYVVAGTPGPTPEVAELAWLGAREIAENMDEAYAIRLIDALGPCQGNATLVRSHDGVHLLEL